MQVHIPINVQTVTEAMTDDQLARFAWDTLVRYGMRVQTVLGFASVEADEFHSAIHALAPKINAAAKSIERKQKEVKS